MIHTDCISVLAFLWVLRGVKVKSNPLHTPNLGAPNLYIIYIHMCMFSDNDKVNLVTQ